MERFAVVGRALGGVVVVEEVDIQVPDPRSMTTKIVIQH